MAKLKNPMFSFTASGSIGGGTLQFRTTRHGPQAVIPALGKIPRQPTATTDQAITRAKFKAIAAEWAKLSASAKAFWNNANRAHAMPNGWSLFLSTRMQEMADTSHDLITPDGQPITDPQGRRLRV